VEEFEKKVQELAQRAKSSQNPDMLWIGRFLELLVFFVTLWWTKQQLAKREQELAEARTEIEQARVKRELELARAKAVKLNNTAVELITNALTITNKTLDLIAKEQLSLKELKADLEKVQNFEELNRIAGVKS
jgi:hypothetical protein